MSNRWEASSADGAALATWIGPNMCTLTQRELDFLAGLKTGWRRLYRRELLRLSKREAEVDEAQPEQQPVLWRVVPG